MVDGYDDGKEEEDLFDYSLSLTLKRKNSILYTSVRRKGHRLKQVKVVLTRGESGHCNIY